METTRQQKVASQIQQDISAILGNEASGLVYGSLVTVSAVQMSPDLSFAKIFVSIFPFEKGEEVLKKLRKNVPFIRHTLGNKVGKQLRITPEIAFFKDDSLERVERLEKLINS